MLKRELNEFWMCPNLGKDDFINNFFSGLYQEKSIILDINKNYLWLFSKLVSNSDW